MPARSNWKKRRDSAKATLPEKPEKKLSPAGECLNEAERHQWDADFADAQMAEVQKEEKLTVENAPGIPKEEQDLAAMFLATSNLGGREPKTPDRNAVIRAWNAVQDEHGSEGISVIPELNSWKDSIRCGDSYPAFAWAEFKAQCAVRAAAAAAKEA